MPPRVLTLSPAASLVASEAPGAPRKKRAIVRKVRRAPGSLEARKAADKLRDILSGKTNLPKSGAGDLIAAVRENLEKLTQEAQDTERAAIYDEYSDLCAEHAHICSICTDPLAPLAIEPQAIRGLTPACPHIRKYHLKCLMESEMHVCYASNFDGGVSSFGDSIHYKVKCDEGMWSLAARAAMLVITCPDCRTLTKIMLPSYNNIVADHGRRSLAFVPCEKPAVVEHEAPPRLNPFMNLIPSMSLDEITRRSDSDSESIVEIPRSPSYSPSSPGHIFESPSRPV